MTLGQRGKFVAGARINRKSLPGHHGTILTPGKHTATVRWDNGKIRSCAYGSMKLL